MGTEVINISIDEQSASPITSTESGTSNQVNDVRPKSPSVDESGIARRDLWGPRLFRKVSESKEFKESDQKSSELKELKESEVSKEPDAKAPIVTSSEEVSRGHHDETFYEGETMHIISKEPDIEVSMLAPSAEVSPGYDDETSHQEEMVHYYISKEPSVAASTDTSSREESPDHQDETCCVEESVHCIITQDAQTPQQHLNPESQKPNHTESDSHVMSTSKPSNVVMKRDRHATSNPLSRSSEKPAAGGSRPFVDHAANANKPLKVNILQNQLSCQRRLRRFPF